jgi:hypothetical protein
MRLQLGMNARTPIGLAARLSDLFDLLPQPPIGVLASAQSTLLPRILPTDRDVQDLAEMLDGMRRSQLSNAGIFQSG